MGATARSFRRGVAQSDSGPSSESWTFVATGGTGELVGGPRVVAAYCYCSRPSPSAVHRSKSRTTRGSDSAKGLRFDVAHSAGIYRYQDNLARYPKPLVKF